MLNYLLKIKEEAEGIQNKIVKYNFQLLAHKGSGFDSYVVLNILPQCRTVVSLIKNGSGIVSV